MQVLFSVAGPFVLPLFLFTGIETTVSLKNKLFIGAFNPCRIAIEWSICSASGALGVLYYLGYGSYLESAFFYTMVLTRAINLGQKYGSYSEVLRAALRNDRLDTRHVHVRDAWVGMPREVLRAELRRALSQRGQTCKTERQVRVLKCCQEIVPEARRRPATAPSSFGPNCEPFEVVAGASIASSATASNRLRQPTIDEASDGAVSVFDLAEIMIACINDEMTAKWRLKLKNPCLWRVPLAQVSSVLIAFIPLFVRTTFSAQLGISHLTFASVLCYLVLAWGTFWVCFTNLVQVCLSVFDMQRRLEIQLAFLSLMGPHVFDDLRGHDKVFTAMQNCAFSGVVIDLSDASTVMALQVLYRGLRLLGLRWSLRAQTFVGILLLNVAVVSIVLVVFAFLPEHFDLTPETLFQIYAITVPICTIYYGTGLMMVIRAIDHSAHINFLAESYLPLALETARLRLQMDFFGVDGARSFESFAACDASLLRLKTFVSTLQKARPLKVLGFSTSASVTGLLQVLALTVATSLARIYNINVL